MPECAKTHLYSNLEFQNFQGGDPRIPLFKGREGRGGEGGESEGKEGGEGYGREGRDRGGREEWGGGGGGKGRGGVLDITETVQDTRPTVTVDR